MTPDVIADCKYRIDRLNQERNDRIERVDACLVALLSPLLPASPAPHINTESLGMAIDRLSILSLKIWHMDEQVRQASRHRVRRGDQDPQAVFPVQDVQRPHVEP